MAKQPNPNRPKFAQLIAEGRENKKITQSKLAKKIGRDTASIKKYEGGVVTPPFFVLMDIAEQLSISKIMVIKSVLDTENARNWLISAFDSIDEIVFAKTLINADLLLSIQRVRLQYNGKENTIDAVAFLLKANEIRNYAKKKYDEIMLDKIGNLSIDIINGSITDDNIDTFVIDENKNLYQ